MHIEPGFRVEVVFAGRRLRGLVLDVVETTDVPASRLRDIRRPLGEHRWVTPEEMEVLHWAAKRYAGSLASVIRHALPRRIIDVERRAAWFPPGSSPRPDDPPTPDIDEHAWDLYETSSDLRAAAHGGTGALYWRPLPGEDLGTRLVELAGLTLAGGRDVLLIIPEPVSSAADAVAAAYRDLTVDTRGGKGDRATYRAWLQARCGQARVVIGERGAAFWPLERLGLGIVVDESSPALKERRSPRHHAREVVLERCRRARAAAVLIGHVPSAIAWRLLAERRLTSTVPHTDAERSRAPVVRVDDRSDPRSQGRLGTPAVRAMQAALDADRLAVVLATRRGEGRALACSDCGLRAACPNCDSSLAAGDGGPRAAALCEGCGWEPDDRRPRCVRCGSNRFAPLAAGARRLGAEIRRMLPGVEVAVLEGYAQQAPEPPAVVVMTRGSVLIDPPGPVGAVVMPDMEAMLRRPTLDAAEDALRLALRVAAWTATRGAPSAAPAAPTRGAEGVVVVQTREPEHHAVQALVRWDPGGFWREESTRRAELRFPPAGYAIRLEVSGDGNRVADDLRGALPDGDAVLGPRRDGERSGLLVKSDERLATLEALAPLRRAWSEAGVDVRLDVDPVDVA